VEPFAEGNNVQFTALFVERPDPADLVVSSIDAPAVAMVNSDLDVSWTVTNQGQNPASGLVYLSQDSLLDINDIRIGIKDLSANLAPLGSQTRSLTMTATPGVPIGEYHLLVQTDAANNIVESSDTNNIAVAEEKILITVPELPLEIVETTTLVDAASLFYRIEIPDSLAGETMLVSIAGDSLNGRNEIYLSYDQTPTRARHDFSHGSALMGEQDLVVPAVEAGTYYLLAYGVNLAGSEQTVDLQARIIEFQVRSIVANTGGNTGSVTALVTGAKFSENMGVELYDETLGSISASNIYFVNPTTIFATFNLSGAEIGKYDVVVSKDASSS